MTIGQLARMFGMSRGTLLHYDAIGLLKPSQRSDTQYRIYTDKDVARLRQITVYRSAGISLAGIRQMLESAEPEGYTRVLRLRLVQLTEDIGSLKRQQQVLVRLLAQHDAKEENEMLNKDQWVALMRATGLTDDDMRRWHKEFEKMSGASHEEFLVSLGIEPKEVAEIRAWSRK
ncbi:MAG: MerR family transcriptional regulator [Candidatus Hydrogenedentes bacterium]|nr:MerR family transcriptional regulator [Candidatus Hydrogenedentota bacterium]